MGRQAGRQEGKTQADGAALGRCWKVDSERFGTILMQSESEWKIRIVPRAS